jgi:hypothetical protein
MEIGRWRLGETPFNTEQMSFCHQIESLKTLTSVFEYNIYLQQKKMKAKEVKKSILFIKF